MVQISTGFDLQWDAITSQDTVAQQACFILHFLEWYEIFFCKLSAYIHLDGFTGRVFKASTV